MVAVAINLIRHCKSNFSRRCLEIYSVRDVSTIDRCLEICSVKVTSTLGVCRHTYSVKDVNDLAKIIKEKYANSEIILLTDKQATKENILKLKEKLIKTGVNDKVIISLSGHGLLSKDLDFYYATYDLDFDVAIDCLVVDGVHDNDNDGSQLGSGLGEDEDVGDDFHSNDDEVKYDIL